MKSYLWDASLALLSVYRRAPYFGGATGTRRAKRYPPWHANNGVDSFEEWIMKCHRSASVAVAMGILVLAAICAPTAWAQAQGVSAKPLLRTALTGDDTKEVVIVTA